MASTESAILFENVLVIGTGLIGGSLAKGLRDRNLVSHIAGYGRRQEQLQLGIEAGVIDSAVTHLEGAVSDADLIVLGVPTLTVKQYLPLIDANRKSTSVVTDVASVKGEIADAIVDSLGAMPSWFVLGHPIAGSEKSGITASNADLYVNHKVILTPVENTCEHAHQSIEKMWQAVGAEVVSMSVEDHDKVLAATSHLPHALAFALVDTLNNMDEKLQIFEFAAGGFRDFTRIASSHPVMWHDIMLANKSAILSVMSEFKDTLADLEQAIASDDGAAILKMFEDAKAARDDFALLLQNRQAPRS